MFTRVGYCWSLHCDAVCGGVVREGAMALAQSALCCFSVTPSTTHKQIGPFWCCFLSGWACVCSRSLWISPTNSPVRLRVSPPAALIPTGVSKQWFEALYPCTVTLGCVVCHLVHQLLPRLPAAALPTQLHNPWPSWVCQLRLAMSPLHPTACLCPSYQSGWMFLLYLLGCWTSIQFDFLSVLVVFCF